MSAFRWTAEWARENRVSTIAELETTSTNARAKEEVVGSIGRTALYLADHQTMGRGRGNHQWTDQPGHALLSSWVFICNNSPQPIFSCKVGLALFNAAKSVWPKIVFALKAPNDLHIIGPSATKVAGLLIEVVSLDSKKSAVVIGLGLNTHGAPQGTEPYPATCLSRECVKVEQPLCEADFRNFLSKWHQGCVLVAQNADASELSAHECQALMEAMSEHPDFAELKQVTPQGSLIFQSGRILPWSDL